MTFQTFVHSYAILLLKTLFEEEFLELQTPEDFPENIFKPTS